MNIITDCILNKQYTKEEYEGLVSRIIEHMRNTGEFGEFFPPRISPFGYNESLAQEHFPFTKEDAEKESVKWSDYERPALNANVIKAVDLPQNIKDVSDDILDNAIECEVSKRPFRIIKQELEFYRSQGLPLPRRHPDQRYLDRNNLRRPRKLTKRNCMKCEVEMQSTYAPNRPEKVYCEKCYLEEVY